jgi:hypothetical protein
MYANNDQRPIATNNDNAIRTLLTDITKYSLRGIWTVNNAASNAWRIYNTIFILTLLARCAIIQLCSKQQMLSNLLLLPFVVNHQKSESVG